MRGGVASALRLVESAVFRPKKNRIREEQRDIRGVGGTARLARGGWKDATTVLRICAGTMNTAPIPISALV
jgi:hypothetical protein